MKFLRCLMAFLFVIVFISMISQLDDSYADVPVDSVHFEKAETEVVQDWDHNFRLYYTVLPENATDKTVTITSSNTSVVVVHEYYDHFEFSTWNCGDAVITVTTNDGGHTDTCTVTVVAGYIYFYCNNQLVEKRIMESLSAPITMPKHDGTVGWQEHTYDYHENGRAYLVGEEARIEANTRLDAVQPKDGYFSYEFPYYDDDPEAKVLLMKQLIDDGYSIAVSSYHIKGKIIRMCLDCGIQVHIGKAGCFSMILLECPVGDDQYIDYSSSGGSSSWEDDKCIGFNEEMRLDSSIAPFKVKLIGNPEKMKEGTWVIESNGVRTETVEEDGRQTAVVEFQGNLRGVAKETEPHPIFLAVLGVGAFFLLVVLIFNRSFRRGYVPPEKREGEQ
ncbi:MAG: Ig domain-containing protein [Candidatus Methanomethylophilaceae archaeon]|nr:Ig domain-containing protein [Candidatus Methanomethylophilaceae archaeon]